MNRIAAELVLAFDDLGRADVAVIGGKNASLGEMISQLQGSGVRVPRGFATTAPAYWQLIDASGLRERISHETYLNIRGRDALPRCV